MCTFEQLTKAKKIEGVVLRSHARLISQTKGMFPLEGSHLDSLSSVTARDKLALTPIITSDESTVSHVEQETVVL